MSLVPELNLAEGANSQNQRKIAARIESDLDFTLFYLMPCLRQFRLDEAWLSQQTGLSPAVCREQMDDLFRTGFWKKNVRKGLVSVELGAPQLDYNSQKIEKDFLSTFLMLSLQMQIRIESGQMDKALYDIRTQSTTHELYHQYKRDVMALTQKFIKDSDAVASDVLVTFSHTFLRSDIGVKNETHT